MQEHNRLFRKPHLLGPPLSLPDDPISGAGRMPRSAGGEAFRQAQIHLRCPPRGRSEKGDPTKKHLKITLKSRLEFE